MEEFKPEDDFDCKPINCFICKYRNEEHCFNCKIREEFFKTMEDPTYEPKLESRFVIEELDGTKTMFKGKKIIKTSKR